MIYKIKLVYFRKKITIQKTQFTFVNDQTHVMKIIVIFALICNALINDVIGGFKYKKF